MVTVSQLFVYPVKSLAGIALDRAEVTDRGLAHDRRYLLVTADGRFMTQRKYPRMALLQPVLTDRGLEVFDTTVDGSLLAIDRPTAAATADQRVTVWRHTVDAQHVSGRADSWFTRALGVECRLVYMPDTSLRPVAPSSGLRPAGKLTSFADAYPFLLAGEASLANLNLRYPGVDTLTMARFRPNIVCRGSEAYAEDGFGTFSINGISFTALEKCARCGVPNVDPQTAAVNPSGEPLRTLASYRREGSKVNFGVNLIHSGTGGIAVGDVIQQNVV